MALWIIKMLYGQCLLYGRATRFKRLLRFMRDLKRTRWLHVYIPLPNETSQEEL